MRAELLNNYRGRRGRPSGGAGMLSKSKWKWSALRATAVAVLVIADHAGVLPGPRHAICHAQDQADPPRERLLAPYEQRVVNIEAEQSQLAGRSSDGLPANFEPWWNGQLSRPMREPYRPIQVDVQGLVLGAIRYSPKIMAIRGLPEIRRTAIIEAQATFDVQTFVESKFTDTSDPVGNTLTTGGPPRYHDHNVYSNGGIRQKTSTGGQWELAQRFGYENSNSLYFVPDPQGTAKLALSYTQPILRGAGSAYNQSLIVLAEIDASVAADAFAAGLQDHLFEVNRAYWGLYLERVALLQKRRLCEQARKILAELRARQRLDAAGSQLVRAESALAVRQSNLIRAEASVRSAEARIQLLVNDPEFQAANRFELITVETPCRQYTVAAVRENLLTALRHRPDLDQAIKQIRAASVQADVAANELLPVLNAVVTTYVSGLEGQGRIGNAWVDQFSVGEPSYSAGLEFEMPWGNRAAKARAQRRRLELRQYGCQLNQTVAQVVHDVELAVREVNTSYREIQARYRAMLAAGSEINWLQDRWRLLPGEEQVAGILLGDVLTAQERLAEAEYRFAAAQVDYSLSLAGLQRATGTLVNCDASPNAADPVGIPEPLATPTPTPSASPAVAPQLQRTPLAPDPLARTEVRQLPPVQ
jgi:outer membrane protein